MKHKKKQTPAYLIWVEQRPSSMGKGKTAYFKAVKAAASAAGIKTPITTPDIEVEIVYSTIRRSTERMDADNVNKPTLDALKGTAYIDDRQVRSVTSIVFDRTIDNVVNGIVEHMGRLFYSPHPDVVLIPVFSDTRLADLGGEKEVQNRRYVEWQCNFDRMLSKMKKVSA